MPPPAHPRRAVPSTRRPIRRRHRRRRKDVLVSRTTIIDTLRRYPPNVRPANESYRTVRCEKKEKKNLDFVRFEFNCTFLRFDSLFFKSYFFPSKPIKTSPAIYSYNILKDMFFFKFQLSVNNSVTMRDCYCVIGDFFFFFSFVIRVNSY